MSTQTDTADEINTDAGRSGDLNVTSQGDTNEEITPISRSAEDIPDTCMLMVPSRCNENIFNAFLILKYREDLQLKCVDFPNYRKHIERGLAILSYIIMIFQWVSLLLLMRFIMLSSGVSINDWGKQQLSTKAYYLFPFLFFGAILTEKELSECMTDIQTLRTWNIDANHRKPLKWNTFHVWALKYFGEAVMGSFGSSVYFIILTIYSKTTDWEDILNVVLNLLAYQFIMDTDEWAYVWMAGRIRKYIARSSPQDNIQDIFEGHRKEHKKPSAREIYTIYSAMISALIWTTTYLALLSHNEAFLFGAIVGGFLVYIPFFVLCVSSEKICNNKPCKN